MIEEVETLRLSDLVQRCRERAAQPPVKRSRRTIVRHAQQVIDGAERCSGGVYWTPERIAAYHPDDFEALCERIGAAGVQGMSLRGELCFHCEP